MYLTSMNNGIPYMMCAGIRYEKNILLFYSIISITYKYVKFSWG
ncbi:MAG: hypothetical protein H6Q52_1986 [Deltaproteobacteria bacterium]|nr:hypothetical protein [Deltaproteobacteria bacterium]